MNFNLDNILMFKINSRLIKIDMFTEPTQSTIEHEDFANETCKYSKYLITLSCHSEYIKNNLH
jgi:hypothetical protein